MRDIINGDYYEWNIMMHQEIVNRWDGERHDRLCPSGM